ncbi:hypothetical protein MHTCC0001_06240 [Flavobacteriaceae bacterium MHTCC 0001]
MTNFPHFYYELTTQLFILKTKINAFEATATLKPMLDKNPDIIKWTIDNEDIDNVLKIQATVNIDEDEIITKIRGLGLYCDILDD